MKRRVVASGESTLMQNPVDYLSAGCKNQTPHQLQEENAMHNLRRQHVGAENLGSSSSSRSSNVLREETVETPARKLQKISATHRNSSTFASSCWKTIGIQSDLDIPENHDCDNLLSPFKREAELEDFPLNLDQDIFFGDEDEFFLFNERQDSLDKEQDNEGQDTQEIRQNKKQDKKQERKTEKKAKDKGETETRQGWKQGHRPGRMDQSRKPVPSDVPKHIVNNANAPIQNVPDVDIGNSKVGKIAGVPILLDGYAIPDRLPTTYQHPQRIR